MRTDVIAALITGPPPSGVAVIRLSGAGAWETGRSVFPSLPRPVVSHVATYGHFTTGDDGLALPFAHGKSFTGEESVELSIHGSAASIQALLEACIAAGARLAEPGEYTLRAFMNGRIDLSQAEGVRATVDSRTAAQLKQANRLRSGQASHHAKEIRDQIVTVLTAVEASTDFSEEIGELDHELARTRLTKIREQIIETIKAAPASRVLMQGLTVVIAGQPNAGKSSLLNRLLGSDRAIVTEFAGTTRDTVEEVVEFGGVLCRLVDTAGLRESEDPIERAGIHRSLEALESSHMVLYVYDSQVGWQEADETSISRMNAPVIVVANKSDLPGSAGRGLSVSCATGDGLQQLQDAISRLIPKVTDEMPYLLDRHLKSFQAALSGIEAALATIGSDVPDDLLAIDLRSASRHLGEISGETTPDDIIDRIFHDFCIGK